MEQKFFFTAAGNLHAFVRLAICCGDPMGSWAQRSANHRASSFLGEPPCWMHWIEQSAAATWRRSGAPPCGV